MTFSGCFALKGRTPNEYVKILRECYMLKQLCNLVHDLELLKRLEIGQVRFCDELIDLKATLQTTLSRFLKRTPEHIQSHISMGSSVLLLLFNLVFAAIASML